MGPRSADSFFPPSSERILSILLSFKIYLSLFNQWLYISGPFAKTPRWPIPNFNEQLLSSVLIRDKQTPPLTPYTLDEGERGGLVGWL